MALLYVVLNVPAVQQRIAKFAIGLLEEKTHAKVSIGSTYFELFNRVILKDVCVEDLSGDTLLFVGRLAANLDVWELANNSLIINSVQLYNFDLNLRKETPASALNLQFIIDAFKTDQPAKSSLDNIELHTLILRKGRFSFHVISELPNKTQFDPNHVVVSDLSLNVALHMLTKDSLDAEISRMALKEASGFDVKDISLNLRANHQMASIKRMKLAFPHGNLYFRNLYADYSDIVVDSVPQIDRIKFNVQIEPSKFYLPDIAAFVPILKGFDHYAQLQLDFTGRLDSMSVDELNLSIENKLSLSTHGTFIHPLHPEKAYVDARVTSLSIHSPLLYEFITTNLEGNKRDFLPLAQLGLIRFNADVKGHLQEFSSNGRLSTSIGRIDYRLRLGMDTLKKKTRLTGSVQTSLLKLKSLLLPIPLTDLQTKADFDFALQDGQVSFAKGDVDITHLVYNAASFDGIALTADYTNHAATANLKMDNANGEIALWAKVNNLQRKGKGLICQMDLSTKNVNITPFLAEGVEPLVFSIEGGLDVRLSELDGLIGEVGFQNIGLNVGNRMWSMESFLLKSELVGDNERRMQIYSPILNGTIDGRYQLANLPGDLTLLTKRYLPGLFPFEHVTLEKGRVGVVDLSNDLDNEVRIDLEIGNTEQLSKVLKLPFAVLEPMRLTSSYSNFSHDFFLDLDAPLLELPVGRVQGTLLKIENLSQESLAMDFSTLMPMPKDTMMLHLSANALSNNLFTEISWSNKVGQSFSGMIAANSAITITSNNEFTLNTRFSPTSIVLNDSIWNIGTSEVSILPDEITISDFSISRENQYLNINGKATPLASDSLFVGLKNIDLDYIFSMIYIEGVTFGGIASGAFCLNSVLDYPRIMTDNLSVLNFSLNQGVLGDLSVQSEWDKENEAILLLAEVRDKGNLSKVSGYISPTKNNLLLDISAQQLNLSFLEYWLGEILMNPKGTASGNIQLFGDLNKLNLRGAIDVEDLNFSVDFINTNYTLSDSIFFEPNKIYFKQLDLTDRNGNKGLASGLITHTNLVGWKFDVKVNAQSMNVFDVAPQNNDLYFGTVFATGLVQLQGDESVVNIDVRAKSTAGSKFTFLIPKVKTANDYSFMQFKTADVDSTALAVKAAQEPKRTSVMNVNLVLEATPDVNLSMVLDQATGDVIKAVGGGTMSLNYNTVEDEIKLFGTYTIDRGSYGFSFQNIFNRDFTISSGSTVTLNGDPVLADMDIKAVYNVSANLMDLNRSFSDVTRSTVPVQCLLNIMGTLDRLSLDFDLNLPTNTDDVNRRVKNVIGSDDMMNRQIIYLMLLGRFYAVDYTNMVGANTGELTSAVLSSTVSALFGNILSEINPNWKIGANYRVNSLGNFKDAEVALSSQLLNNRLLFNGNFGYREDLEANSSFIGDFDLEYILNDAGTLSVKAYNKTNEKNYYIKSSLTTQGVGVMYKKSFSSVKELFRERLFDPQKKSSKSSKKTPKSQ